MRCSICDWSPDIPSIYHDGLFTGHANKKLIRHSNDYTCSDCTAVIIEDIQEMTELEYEKQEDHSNPAWLFTKRGKYK